MGKYILTLLIITSSLWANTSFDVSVSILPQKRFVEAIAGERVHVNVMVLPNHSPAVYEPKPRQMAVLSKSKLYFSIGVPFEKVWLKRFQSTNPKLQIINTAQGIQKRSIDAHHHEEDHEHHHKEAKDPHIWLDPSLVLQQLKTIKDALIVHDPQGKAFYESNYARYVQVVRQTDNTIRTILKNSHGKKFLVFHPSWGYFAHAYHLEQIAVEVEGKSPKPKELAHLIHEAKEEQISAVFISPQFSKRALEVIAKELHVPIIAINPLSENWSENLINVAKALKH
jgi:zinc transport system substrate-binding protein